MKPRVLFSSCAAIALLIAGLYAVFGWRSEAAVTSANFVQERLELPPMELIDQEARRRDLTGELTKDALVIINFNYTTCESICPIGNDVMAQLDDRVDQVDGRPIRLLSITIDPARDTVAKLNAAARQFEASDRWVWLTGDPREIDRVLRSFDVAVADIELHDPIFIVGDAATGRYYRSLSMPTPDELIDLLRAIAA